MRDGGGLWKARAKIRIFRVGYGAGAGARLSQGASWGDTSILACAKHFAGYGAAEGGRDYDSSYIPEVELRNVYLEPVSCRSEAGLRHADERLHGPE